MKIKNIVAVTACPTGVAHTFMAADILQETAKNLDIKIKIETRGSIGSNNKLTEEDIKKADLVFLACDIEIDQTRFIGKRVYKTSVSKALKNTEEELEKAIIEAIIYQSEQESITNSNQLFNPIGHVKGAYKHLMTGVSYMLPVVVAGGLLIALSFVFGINAFEQQGTIAAALMQIGGKTAFGLMIPFLSGFIAYSIADRPGLAPGFIGGMLASSIGSGFLGGIIAGFIAGYFTNYLNKKLVLPKTIDALKPILIIPLFSSLFVGLIMIYILGGPIAIINQNMTSFLQNMSTANAVILGLIIGAMMCFDLGGPVNKAAYTFGVGLLANETYQPMAAVMASGMVPPLAIGLVTLIHKKSFTKAEQDAGKAALVLGSCFISEGAIPFAARDPFKAIPSFMLGGAITGALSMMFNIKLLAPHGGFFVFLIPNAISNIPLYLLTIASGTLVTIFIYILLMKLTNK